MACNYYSLLSKEFQPSGKGLELVDGMSIFDAKIIKEGTRDEFLAVANLAMRCLNSNGKNRPTMKEVEVELENIRVSHVPFTVQNDSKQVMYREEIQMITYGESTSTSTFMSVGNISQ